VATQEATQERRRDAAGTQQRLREAALHRFAAHGYAATCVRDIAQDAQANVALINRYFGSKEGLFRACLSDAAGQLRREPPTTSLPERIARELVDTGEGRPVSRMLLLLRTSGDANAEAIRLEILHSFARRIAEAQGADEMDDARMLRAQTVLAAVLGLAVVRATGLEPLSSASTEELTGLVRETLEVMLGS
jgi:AcrR family transcriptional regulator